MQHTKDHDGVVILAAKPDQVGIDDVEQQAFAPDIEPTMSKRSQTRKVSKCVE